MTAWRVVQAALASSLFVGCIPLLFLALEGLADPASPLRKYRDAPVPPHVVARGILHGEAKAPLPPLCSVRREHYGWCGKNRCWRSVATLKTADGTLDPVWSSSPLPPSLGLSTTWLAEPALPAIILTDPTRIAAWQKQATHASVRFDHLGDDRLVEQCVTDGASIYLEGCVVNGKLAPCADQQRWSFVVGTTPRPAIVEASCDIALMVAGVFLLLLVVPLLLVAPHRVMVEALASRAAIGKPTLGWLKALFVTPLVVTGLALKTDPNRIAFAIVLAVLVLWGLLVKSLANRRRRVFDALAPILATDRSLLAQASGAVELVVKARGQDATRALDPTPAAFVETRVFPVYRSGSRTQELPPIVFRPQREIAVVDESGEGAVDLEHAVLDVPVREETFPDVPPRLAERGVRLEKHPQHVQFRVEERAIEDGQTLYVLGVVSQLALRPDGAGYRSVRGLPTIGGQGSPPVLVFAGDERGLVASLRREAFGARALAIGSASAAGLLAGLATYLVLQ